MKCPSSRVRPSAVRSIPSLSVVVLACVLALPSAARADAVLDWNIVALNAVTSQPAPANNPFAQARFMAITQLAVFEAVNAITQKYEPYLGGISAPSWASADAAAIAAAHKVLSTYFASNAATIAMLTAARTASLGAIPDGPAKTRGIEVGEAAGAAMLQNRMNDGATPATVYMPSSVNPGDWQLTPTPAGAPPCAAGLFYNWKDLKPFGIESADDFVAGPPPSLTSREYTKDYDELKRVGGINSTARPQDRTDVARFYAATSPALLLNSLARQLAIAKGDGLAENARALALLNMASSDSLVVSFATKYLYNFWRPVTAIRAGDNDTNPDTEGDLAFTPLITTPCFPSYGSNHASGSYGGAEVLRRLYGAGGHDLTLSNPTLPAIVLHYAELKDVCQDIDDARVFGGIHFRFDQEAGARIGREVATDVVKHNLRKAKGD